jgi:hypothetical protein
LSETHCLPHHLHSDVGYGFPVLGPTNAAALPALHAARQARFGAAQRDAARPIFVSFRTQAAAWSEQLAAHALPESVVANSIPAMKIFLTTFSPHFLQILVHTLPLGML